MGTPSGRSTNTSPASGSRPQKRSFAIKGHRTSVSMETAFWEALQQAALQQGISASQLVADIDAVRGEAGLSSAIRVWLLEYYRRPQSPAPRD